MGDKRLQIGDWLVEPERNLLSGESKERSLETRAMDVLVHLAENAPRTVAADELLERFWAGRVVESSTVHRTISKIRNALGDTSGKRAYIETVPKRGYRVVAEVARASSSEPEAENKGATATDYLVVPGISGFVVEESDVVGLGRVRVPRVSCRLGRGPDNDLVLDDRSVSKNHARITLVKREWQIRDEGSTNGVTVNGDYVESAPLSHGDVIQLGVVQLRFEIE